MESEMIFMTAVLGVAGISIAFRVVNFLVKLKGSPAQQTVAAGKRDDWYVFFDRKTLLGTKDESSVQPDGQSKNTTSTPVHEDRHIAQEVYV